jgi:3-mercaptopyruvate sulfurtransferase SseA
MGYRNVEIIDGGVEAWKQAGLPLKGKRWDKPKREEETELSL